MDWSNDKILEFIDQYGTEPILWNPKEPGYKRKDLIYDAWVRIKDNLGWNCTIHDLKKKRDSLMAYYRQHLNRHKKSVESGTATDDLTSVNWFAFGALHSFLQPIYDCKSSIKSQFNDEDDDFEKPLRYDKTRVFRPKRTRNDLSAEIIAAGQQMTEAFNHVKNNNNDEYEMFGKLIASKIKKIRDPNVKEILMNDIHNMIFKAYMMENRDESTAQLPQSFESTIKNELQPSHSFSTNSPLTSKLSVSSTSPPSPNNQPDKSLHTP